MTSSTALPFRCRCGEVRGTLRDLRPRAGIRVVCHCRSCRTWVERLGKPELLTTAGGTDLFQTAPSNVRIERGIDQLRCGRQTPNGVARWFTACCRTPIANTPPTTQLPLVALFVDTLEGGAQMRDSALGPVRYRIEGSDAVGTPPPGTVPRTSLRHWFGMLAQMLRTRLRGRDRPHPFFDEAGVPVAPMEAAPAASP